MKKWAKFWNAAFTRLRPPLTFAVLLVIAGCVPCLNPIYTDADLIVDPALPGTWGSSDSKEKWVFSKSGAKSYKLTQTDAEGVTAEFDVRLVRLGDYRFLDLVVTNAPENHVRMNGWAAFSLIPGHLIFQVHDIDPKLKISAMNPDWVKEWLEKNSKSIAHRKFGDDRYVILAATADLQKFVLRHAGEEGLFGGPHELERMKH